MTRQTLLLAAGLAVTQVGCAAMWAGAGAAGAATAYEAHNKDELDDAKKAHKRGEISDEELGTKRDEIEDRSLVY